MYYTSKQDFFESRGLKLLWARNKNYVAVFHGVDLILTAKNMGEAIELIKKREKNNDNVTWHRSMSI